MNKIIFQIQENKILIQIKKRLNTDQKNLINTNVISQNELVFSGEYIMQNATLIHNFIKELVNNYNLNTLVIKEFEITPLILHVFSNITNLKNLYLLEESILNYTICDKIIKANSFKYVSLYNIPTFLLEMLDKERIEVNSRNEILFVSNFMRDNNLENFSSLYYKTTIYLKLPFSKEDEDDFLSFININRYLKNIYVNTINKNDIENILEILYNYKLKNIKIHIEQNVHDLELIEYLKKINKKNAKINGIQFKIDYSQDYLEDNLINQIHLNTVKLCIFISLFLISSLVVYVFCFNYASMQKVDDIKTDINNIIAKHKEEEINNDDIEENITNNEEVIEKKLRTELAGLLEMNSDTVGWLKVNDTNVDYPVVQTTDNDYYVNNNFKKEKDSAGWLFMDYRDNSKNLSQNTIIYGHNMFYSGVMFGTLYKTKQSSWHSNPENQIIKFDTLYEELEWQIFSIYVAPKPTDYRITDFETEESYQEFLDKITARSIYDFNIPISTKDKILTLSTCSNNGKNRLAIHAVLISD